MSAAEVLAIRTESETTLRALVAEIREEGIIDHNEIAAELLRRHGLGLFAMVPITEVARALATYVGALTREGRRHAVRGRRVVTTGSGGAQESVLRVAAAGKAYWSAVFVVGGKAKELRDLTTADVEWLIRDYASKAFELRARALWFTKVLSFAREHKAKTLGDLEKKGLSLPELDVPEDED